jgi:hypothetical protein
MLMIAIIVLAGATTFGIRLWLHASRFADTDNAVVSGHVQPVSTRIAGVVVEIAVQDNQPVKGNCNLHSWSDKGKWTNCCYTNDHAQAACMWNKPRDLSTYKGDGFEISYWQSDGANANSAISGWKKSTPHNNMMINRDIWKKVSWNACGVGLYGNYAVVWFGREVDPAGEAKKCQ